MPRWEAVAVCVNSVSKLLDTGNGEPLLEGRLKACGQRIAARRRLVAAKRV